MNGNISTGRIGKRKGSDLTDITSTFSSKQLDLVLQIMAETVDATLHHLLWTLDRVEWLDVLVDTSSGTIPSIKKVSDGLYGELYRWIPEFSEQPNQPTV